MNILPFNIVECDDIKLQDQKSSSHVALMTEQVSTQLYLMLSILGKTLSITFNNIDRNASLLIWVSINISFQVNINIIILLIIEKL